MRPDKTSPLSFLNSIIVRKWQFQIRLSPTNRLGHHSLTEVYLIHQLKIDQGQKVKGEEIRVTKNLVEHSFIHQAVKET